jgi:hypothetical protein
MHRTAIVALIEKIAEVLTEMKNQIKEKMIENKDFKVTVSQGNSTLL